jgi:hypothetical protein
MHDDQVLATKLLRLLDAGAAPISFEEVLERAASTSGVRPNISQPRHPKPTAYKRRRALLRAGALLFVAAAVVLVVVWRVGSSPTKPRVLPASAPLSDAVLIVSAPTGSTRSGNSNPIVVAIDPATGRSIPIGRVPGSQVPFSGEFGTAVRGGGAVVLVTSPAAGGQGTSTNGTAVAVLPGSTHVRVLGPAIGAFAGLTPGTVWLWAGDAYKSNLGPGGGHCSVREVTTGGAVVEGPVPIDCEYTVLGATSSGLLLEALGAQGFGIPLQFWDPRSRQFGQVTGGTDAVNGGPDPAGVVVVDRGVNIRPITPPCSTSCRARPVTPACSTSCRVVIVDAATSRSYSLDLQAIGGVVMSSEPLFSLSPDGRYVAVEEIAPPSLSRTQDSCNRGCRLPVPGELDIFSTKTGQPVLKRKLSFYMMGSGNSSPVVWSPDGSWVFVAATDRSIDAVPAFSATARVETIDLTHFHITAGIGVENFLVTGRT